MQSLAAANGAHFDSSTPEAHNENKSKFHVFSGSALLLKQTTKKLNQLIFQGKCVVILGD